MFDFKDLKPKGVDKPDIAKKYIPKEIKDSGTTFSDEQPGLNVWNYLTIAKNFILNLFVDIQEGKNPSFSTSKVLVWAVLAVIAIIIMVM